MTIKCKLPPVKDHAIGLLSGSYTAAQTSITLATGHGARLPDTTVTGEFQLWFYRTDYSVPYLALYDTPRQAEKVLVTARAGDVLTVVRDPLNPINMNVSGKTYGFAMMPDEYWFQPLIDVMPYSVKRFGAKGDGATDDAAAIQAAIDAAGQWGTVYFPPATYRINSRIDVAYNDITILGYGAILDANFNGVAMRCGKYAAIHQRIRVRGLRFTRPSTDWTAGNTALQFLNTTYSSAIDFSVVGYHDGLQLLGSGGQQLYGTFQPSSIWACKYPIYIYAAGAEGAVNENTFFGGGSLKFTTGQPDVSAGYAIWVGCDGVAPIPNNLKFYGLSLECQSAVAPKPAGAIRLEGLDCIFDGLRYEGFTSPFIKGTASASGNHFVRGVGLEVDDVDLATMGADNHVIGKTTIWHGVGDGANSGVVLRELNADANKVLDIRDTAGASQFKVLGNGKVELGADVSLYRGAANSLKTDDQLEIATAGGNKNELKISGTAANTGLEIGGDCNLYRAAANKLKTDDSLEVAGQVKDARCAYSAHRNGTNQTIATATTTLVQFDTEAYDKTGDYDTTNHKFVAPRAMLLHVDAVISIIAPADGKFVAIYIFKNAAIEGAAFFNSGAASDQSAVISKTIELALNDEVTIKVRHNHGSDRSLDGTSYESYVTGTEVKPL